MINGEAVAWASKKQPGVALSSREAEYIALTQGTKESLWLGGLHQDLGALNHQHQVQILNCDNQGAIEFTKNPEYHARTKYIDIQLHFIRHHEESGAIELTYCPTHAMTADIFTKPLLRTQFQKHLLGLGLADSPGEPYSMFQKLNSHD